VTEPADRGRGLSVACAGALCAAIQGGHDSRVGAPRPTTRRACASPRSWASSCSAAISSWWSGSPFPSRRSAAESGSHRDSGCRPPRTRAACTTLSDSWPGARNSNACAFQGRSKGVPKAFRSREKMLSERDKRSADIEIGNAQKRGDSTHTHSLSVPILGGTSTEVVPRVALILFYGVAGYATCGLSGVAPQYPSGLDQDYLSAAHPTASKLRKCLLWPEEKTCPRMRRSTTSPRSTFRHSTDATLQAVCCSSSCRILCCCSSSWSWRTLMVCSAVSVSWSASARASWLAEMTFWPTMMIGSNTNCRKD
jgi:hypothetical protein